MKENKVLKICFLVFFLVLIVILAYFVYKFYNEKTIELENVSKLNNQVSNLESKVNDLEGKSNLISNSISNIENIDDNDSQYKSKNPYVSYIVLELEDKDAEEKNRQGLEYKNKKITDKNKIDTLMESINSAVPYKEKGFVADFGDVPPCAKIYLSNGESYTIVAGDQIEDNGDIVNLMAKWYSEDGEDKILYRVNTKLGEQIETLFND